MCLHVHVSEGKTDWLTDDDFYTWYVRTLQPVCGTNSCNSALENENGNNTTGVRVRKQLFSYSITQHFPCEIPTRGFIDTDFTIT